MLGIQHIRTTPCYRSSNVTVEWFHCSLKQALRCHETKWSESLPVRLLCLRTCIKKDLTVLPGEMFEHPSSAPTDLAESPYQGQFEVLSWNDKHFSVKSNDKTTIISIDRLKPAFLLNDTNATKDPFPAQKKNSPVVHAPRLDSDVLVPTTTRFDGKVRFNPKFL
ncbi:transposon Tf2-9 polyprotein [Nephila pilipes]|uniref:Transposon Tf2-9 polyprotein n=1 Tax=Nephila pilipes TaxID=299642 RepID=A0A8X6Q4Q9_NEPPI|nr:transposon Tf2-9 polyprotein [Nephila pilipes]